MVHAEERCAAASWPPVPAAPRYLLCGGRVTAQGLRLGVPARAQAQGGHAALSRVLCRSLEKAQAMALLLYQTSANALAEFKRLKRAGRCAPPAAGAGWRSHHPASAAAQAAPARTLLLQTAGGAQPVAPKLGSITEDLLANSRSRSCRRKRKRSTRRVAPRRRTELGRESWQSQRPKKRALVVAMHFECGDLLDTLESGHEEALGAAGSRRALRLGRLCCWATPPT